MILVDVYVPAVNKTYEFKLEDSLYISDIIEEMSDLFAPQEEIDLLLFDAVSQKALSYSSTLRECGVDSGSYLILV